MAGVYPFRASIRAVQALLRATRSLFQGRRAPLGKPFPFIAQEGSALNCCVAYNEHGAYCVPASGYHRPAASFILSGDVWERETVSFIMSRCKDGDIVHAGTFFGDFLPPLGRACGGRIWAFEPNPESYRCASITRELNQLSNVELIQAGLSAESQSARLATVRDGIALGGESRVTASDGEGVVPIKLVAIDDIVPISRHVSAIHLDVEGFEQHALSGAMETVRRCKPILILETLPEESWTVENLAPLGYRPVLKIDENTVFSVVCPI